MLQFDNQTVLVVFAITYGKVDIDVYWFRNQEL